MMLSINQILLATVVILISYYLYFVWEPRYFSKMGVKGPFPLPVVGNMLTVLRKGFLEYSLEISRKYGRVSGVFEGSVPMLIISDPDILQQILVKHFNTFPNRRSIKPGDSILDNFLTALEDDHWRHVRHVMTPAFSTGKLKQMMLDINDCAKLLDNNLLSNAQQGTVVNMKDCCGQFTMDVIARTAFGIEVDTQRNPDSPFVVYAKKIFQLNLLNPAVIVFLFFPFFRPVLRYLGFSLFPRATMDFFKDVVVKAFEGRSEGEHKGSRVDFLQLMVNARNEQKASETQPAEKSGEQAATWSKKGLTENEVIAQCMLFLLAGYDTTASTLSFVTYNLAIHPECQEKLHNEIISVVGDKTEIDFETANNLAYMDQCIQETLRLYPPAIRTDRQAVADITVGDLRIPKGQFIGVQIYALHHDPLIWPEPETFNPDRFNAEAVASHHPCQYMPFGQGPRMCIGMRLAQLELKVALAYLIKHFRFIRCPETEVPLTFKPNGLLQTKNGIQLKVELRA